MKYFRGWMFILTAMTVLVLSAAAQADTFGTGENQFTLDFVPISGATNPTSGYGIVANDYRMGTYEITNDQWNKFTINAGVPTGTPSFAYDLDSDLVTVKPNMPVDNISWYEATQFVNWLNTSTGNQAAYKFTGTQNTSNYKFAAWSSTETGYNAANPFRNMAAKYFLPTEDEWVKAAYWNGTSLQDYATKPGESFTQGHGTGTGWNYYDNGFATSPRGAWNVGSGSQELNGTYDMMGNIREWNESPHFSGNYDDEWSRSIRGGDWGNPAGFRSLGRDDSLPTTEVFYIGFRVACVPEPGSLPMLFFIATGGLLWWRRRS